MLHAARSEAMLVPARGPLRPPPVAAWAASGLALAGLLAGASLLGAGIDKSGLELGLKLTARLAVLAFLPCYAAGSLAILFGMRFDPLKRRARALGLAFAAVMAVHLGLVAALCAIGQPPALRVFLIFGPGAICALAMTLASIGPVGRAIGPSGWWGLRNLAMNYILLDFAIDFWRREPLTSPLGLVGYLPFALLVAVAPLLRLGAWIKQRLA